MASESQDHEQLVANFVDLTGASPETATGFLTSASWDFQSAVTEFFNPDTEEREEPVAQPSAGPDLTPAQTNPPSSTTQPPAKKKFATLGDLRGGTGGAGSAHDHDEDDSDGSDEGQNMFAGGEKSGLAVENPDDLKKKIIERAQKNKPRPGGDDQQPETSNFRGTARTLGGDDAPSRVIEDPKAAPTAPKEVQKRLLHFWTDGFSVDDGPLYHQDDPENAKMLAQIKQGRAPVSILNVQPGAEIDVQLVPHNEKYTAPKKVYKPFGGQGQRLGSPTPGGNDTTAVTTSASKAPSTATTSSASTNQVNVNDSEPVISIQVRLGDGTRLVSRFNTSHTLGDVYDFVNSASAGSRARSWILMTTFPNMELKEKSKKLGDMAELKRGGTVVQKWV